MRISKPESDARKERIAVKAGKFSKELSAIGTPKKTVLVSLKLNYGLSTRQARAAYRKAVCHSRKRH